MKIRKKRLLTALAATFMLVFGVGAALAFAPGVLDVGANVNITSADQAYVVWHSVQYDPDTGPVLSGQPVGAGIVIGGTSTATFANGADGRTFQRIVWDINFDEADFDGFAAAAITAIARNNSSMPAAIASARYSWSNPALAAQLGLTATINDSSFVGTMPAATSGGSPSLSGPLTAMVNWDGSIPGNAGSNEVFTLSLIIEFDYFPIN